MHVEAFPLGVGAQISSFDALGHCTPLVSHEVGSQSDRPGKSRRGQRDCRTACCGCAGGAADPMPGGGRPRVEGAPRVPLALMWVEGTRCAGISTVRALVAPPASTEAARGRSEQSSRLAPTVLASTLHESRCILRCRQCGEDGAELLAPYMQEKKTASASYEAGTGSNLNPTEHLRHEYRRDSFGSLRKHASSIALNAHRNNK